MKYTIQLLLLLALLSPHAIADEPPATVSFDFETGPQGWHDVRRDKLWFHRKTDELSKSDEAPKTGKWMLRTHQNFCTVVESPLFVPAKNAQATFLLGGSGSKHAYVALYLQDDKGDPEAAKPVLQQQVPTIGHINEDPFDLKKITWNLAPYAGKKVYLRVVTKPVGYPTVRRVNSNVLLSFVVLDNFRCAGHVDKEATEKRAAQLKKAKTASMQAIRDQMQDIVFAVRRVDRDGHWYANIGHWAGDTKRKMYHDGARLCRMNTRTGKITVLLEDAGGGIRDPQVHYDAKKILFSYRPGGTQYYNLYEINIDGTNLKRLTFDDYDDFEPTYLSNGQIMFVSTRCQRWVPCYFTEVAVLYRCDGNGKNITPVSSNMEQENTPWPLNDGRILYTRWEYVERSVMDFHHLWVVNPDGTRQTIYYGNSRPGFVMIDGKPIPDSQRIVSIFSPGHGRSEHHGTVTLVDPSYGPDSEKGIECVGYTLEQRDPYPIGQAGFLIAEGHELKLLDYNGNSEVLYTLPTDKLFPVVPGARHKRVWVHEPRPIVKRPREPRVPLQSDPSKKTGTLLVTDIHQGRNMEGITPGSIKKLLIVETLPKAINISNGSEPTSMQSNNHERILGTVPVESDGSAYFQVPARRTVFLAALDKNDLCIKRMQSFLTLQPGERTSCVGCHEERVETPLPVKVATLPLAAQRKPSVIAPITDVPEVFDFPRDIQPILDRHCVACHDYKATKRGGPRAGGWVFGGDLGPVWSHGYASMVRLSRLSVGRAFGNEAPYTTASGASRLMKLISGKHYDVKLSEHEKKMIRLWIDSGTMFCGTLAGEGAGMIYTQVGRQTKRYKTATYSSWFKMPETWAKSVAAVKEVGERRCASCHQGSHLPKWDLTADRPNKPKPGGGPRTESHYTWNLSRPELSMLLLAPLGKEAGGYGRCVDKKAKSKKPVFASTDDPDYQTLLRHCRILHETQNKYPCFSMPGFRPNPHYIYNMKRYGIIPEDYDPADPIDVYAVDQAYWKSFWMK